MAHRYCYWLLLDLLGRLNMFNVTVTMWFESSDRLSDGTVQQRGQLLIVGLALLDQNFWKIWNRTEDMFCLAYAIGTLKSRNIL